MKIDGLNLEGLKQYATAYPGPDLPSEELLRFMRWRADLEIPEDPQLGPGWKRVHERVLRPVPVHPVGGDVGEVTSGLVIWFVRFMGEDE